MTENLEVLKFAIDGFHYDVNKSEDAFTKFMGLLRNNIDDLQKEVTKWYLPYITGVIEDHAPHLSQVLTSWQSVSRTLKKLSNGLTEHYVLTSQLILQIRQLLHEIDYYQTELLRLEKENFAPETLKFHTNLIEATNSITTQIQKFNQTISDFAKIVLPLDNRIIQSPLQECDDILLNKAIEQLQELISVQGADQDEGKELIEDIEVTISKFLKILEKHPLISLRKFDIDQLSKFTTSSTSQQEQTEPLESTSSSSSTSRAISHPLSPQAQLESLHSRKTSSVSGEVLQPSSPLVHPLKRTDIGKEYMLSPRSIQSEDAVSYRSPYSQSSSQPMLPLKRRLLSQTSTSAQSSKSPYQSTSQQLPSQILPLRSPSPDKDPMQLATFVIREKQHKISEPSAPDEIELQNYLQTVKISESLLNSSGLSYYRVFHKYKKNLAKLHQELNKVSHEKILPKRLIATGMQLNNEEYSQLIDNEIERMQRRIKNIEMKIQIIISKIKKDVINDFKLQDDRKKVYEQLILSWKNKYGKSKTNVINEKMKLLQLDINDIIMKYKKRMARRQKIAPDVTFMDITNLFQSLFKNV